MNIILQELILFLFNALIYCTAAALALKIKKIALFFLMSSIIISIFSLGFRFALHFPSFLYGPIIAVTLLIILYIFSSSRIWSVLLFFFIQLIIMTFSEYISVVLAYWVSQTDASYTYELVIHNLVPFRTTYYTIYIFGIGIFVILWRRFYKDAPTYDTYLFYGLLPMLLFQLGYLSIMVELIESSQAYSTAWFVQVIGAGALFGAAQIAMIVLLRVQQKNLEKQNKQKIRLHAMETQFDQFQQMVRQEKSHAKFQHDMNNQLLTIATLYDRGEYEAALLHLHKMLKLTEIESNRTFCANPIINALLSQKMATCQSEGIQLNADISLPSTFTMDEMVLCSVFGNILDNAIQACKKCKGNALEITLVVRVTAGFLLIQCENPAPERSLQSDYRNHWGLEILSDISAQYNGCLQTYEKNGMFILEIGLQIK